MFKPAVTLSTLLSILWPGVTIAEDVEPASRGQCEDAVNEGADVWQLLCGALVAPPNVKSQCFAEHSEGRGKGLARCRFGICESSCGALDDRWELYCWERIPRNLRKVCDAAREIGHNKCLNVCRGRTLDGAEGGDTIGACSPLSQSESSR
jgi:hypothetical protein